MKQKITNLYESYRTLTKHKGRNDKNTAVFKPTRRVFYIAHQDAADIVQCDKLSNTKQKQEDLEFLDALKDGK